jgi:hypothetical protein
MPDAWAAVVLEKKFQRNLKKPLDKHHKLWYNIGTVRERNKPQSTEYKNLGGDQRQKELLL